MVYPSPVGPQNSGNSRPYGEPPPPPQNQIDQVAPYPILGNDALTGLMTRERQDLEYKITSLENKLATVAQRGRLKTVIFVTLVFFLLAASVGGMFVVFSQNQSLRNQLATATQQKGQPSLDQFHQSVQGWQYEQEPLTDYKSSNGIQWTNSNECQMVAGTYRVKALSGHYGYTCTAFNQDQRDIAVLVHMLFLQDDQAQDSRAGLSFRWSMSGQDILSYSFCVQKDGPDKSDGAWSLIKYIPRDTKGNTKVTLASSRSVSDDIPHLFRDLGQPITLAIKAVGDDIDLYINGKYITHYHDGNSYGKGAIGLFAGQGPIASQGPIAGQGPSEVMFSNAEIWTPKS